MATDNSAENWDLVVGADGSISAEQLESLGLRPGAHLRVVPETNGDHAARSAYGVLGSDGSLNWEDFLAASTLAVAEAEPAPSE